MSNNILPSNTLANPNTPLYGGSSTSGVSQIIAGTNVTLSPAGGTGAVTINATSTSGGISSVTGTANQITATTASNAVTLALAAPSPAPTPGSYTSANITVDALGRVTAAANGGGNAPNFNFLLPAEGGGTSNLNTGGPTATPNLQPTNQWSNGSAVAAGTRFTAVSAQQFFNFNGAANHPDEITLTNDVYYRIVLSNFYLQMVSSAAVDYQLDIILWTGSGTYTYPTVGVNSTYDQPVGAYSLFSRIADVGEQRFITSGSMNLLVKGSGNPIKLYLTMISLTTGIPVSTAFTLVAATPTTFYIENVGTVPA